MIKNNNLRICRKLVWREMKFHRGQSIFLGFTIALIAMLYMVLFSFADGMKGAQLTRYEEYFGSKSQILFHGLTAHQAQKLKSHGEVKSSVQMQSLGRLSDELLEYRTVYLAVLDESYAGSVESMPTQGHIPEKDGEIAMDILTLDSLGISHETGQEITLLWTPEGSEEIREETFVLCGIWSTGMGHSETCAWVAPECGKRLAKGLSLDESKTITLGVNVRNSGDLEAQAQALLDDLGMGEVSFTTNLSYNRAVQEEIAEELVSYRICFVFVSVIGFWMVLGILQVSRQERCLLYGKMKGLGMTPRQVFYMIVYQGLFSCLPAIPAGILGGGLLFWLTGANVILRRTGFFDWERMSHWNWVFPVLMTFVTVCVACLVSEGGFITGSPEEIRNRTDDGRTNKKKNLRKRTTVWNLALQSLRRGRGSLTVTALALFASTLLLGGTYILYISFDEKIYTDETFTSDYAVMDVSCGAENQRYNEKAGHVTEVARELSEQPELLEMAEWGETLSREVSLCASPELLKMVTEFYEMPSEWNPEITRREEMADSPDWQEGLGKFAETGEYRSVVYGMSGVALDYQLRFGEVVAGAFDAEKYASGDYVIAHGLKTDYGDGAAVPGMKVEIGGKTFTVMMTVESSGGFPAGRNSRAAEFCLNYVMPPDALRELYPEINVRQIDINVKDGMEEAFAKAFAPYLEREGIVVRTKTQAEEEFRTSTQMEVTVQFFIGIMMFVISLLNFMNMVLSQMLVRKKEFALYQGLGMEPGQLKRLVFYEGLLHGVAALLAVIPVSLWLLWSAMPDFVANQYIWAITYRFSVWPLAVISVILLLVAVAVPQLALTGIEKKSIVDRLRDRE